MPARKKTEEATETVAFDTEAALENGYSTEEITNFENGAIPTEISDQWGDQIIDHLQAKEVSFSFPFLHLMPALLEVQEDLGQGGVGTSGEGKVGSGGSRSYEYSKKEDIVTKVKPALSKHGVLWMQFPFGDNKFGNLFVKNNEYFWFSTTLPVGTGQTTSSSQEWGKALTYFSRYTSLSFFILSPGHTEDNDAGIALADKPSFKYLENKIRQALDLPFSDPSRSALLTAYLMIARDTFGDWTKRNQEDFTQMVAENSSLTAIRDEMKKPKDNADAEQPVATDSATQQQVEEQPVAQQQVEQTPQQRVKQNVEQIQNNTQRRVFPNAR